MKARRAREHPYRYVCLVAATMLYPSDSGQPDIYMATRTNASSGFGVPRKVTELNESAWQSPTWISPDNCRLYYARIGTGARDLWVASR